MYIFNVTICLYQKAKKMIKNLVYSLGLVCFCILFLANCANQKTEEKSNIEVMQKKVGVQIYSVRNELEKDFNGTLEKLSEIGFNYIEAYGLSTDGTLYGMSPTDYKNTVEYNGMSLVSSHSTYFTVEEAPVVIKAAKQAGLEYVIVPWLNEDLRSDYDAIAKTFNEVGAMFKEAGIGFGYHNHDFEFFPIEDGRIPLEILIEGTDPENVDFQLDLYWVAKAGSDPVAFINKYPGRFASFHVKDADKELNQTTVGEGIIDFKTILSAPKVSGMKFYFIEDERTDDPIGNLSKGLGNLKNLDY